jgi:hypothetical protein
VLLVSFGDFVFWGFLSHAVILRLAPFFGCARLCNCLCPIMGFLIYNTLLIKKKQQTLKLYNTKTKPMSNQKQIK